MWAAIKRFFAPPVFEGNEDKTRSAQLLNTLLWLVFTGVVIFTASVLFTLQNEMEPLVLIIAIMLGIVTTFLFILLRRGYVLTVGIILALTLWVGFSIPMFNFAGIHDSAITGYFFIIALVGVVAGWRTIVFFTGITAAALITSYYMEQAGILVATIPVPSKIDDLILVLLMVGSTALMLWYAVQRISRAYKDLRQSTKTLELSNHDLEAARNTVTIQAMELEQRTHYLATTTLIARESAALLDTPEIMMHRVVEIISDAFDYYLVSIFLVDEVGEWAELAAASSEEGKRLIDRNFRLRIGTGWAGEGIIGNVADTGRMRVVRDVTNDDVYVDTSELPDTVSEVAFPLMARGLVIGVVDIQSNRKETFLDTEIELLQGLVNQVALAVDNANLVKRLKTSSVGQGSEFHEASSITLARILESGDKVVVSDSLGTDSRAIDWQPEMVKALQTGEIVASQQRTKVSLPIMSRDQIIGVIDAQLPVTDGEWTVEQLGILQSITEQLGTTLESAQLYDDTQRRAARETLSREIVDKMRNTMSFEELLQTTLREITEVTGASRAFVQWLPSDNHTGQQDNDDH